MYRNIRVPISSGVRIPNLEPQLLEIRNKESELRTRQSNEARVLSRLENLEVTPATKAIFQRYVTGELTLADLDSAIDQYLTR